MAGKFELKRVSNGQFAYFLKASNGEPILNSNEIQSKAEVENVINSVKTNAPIDSRYMRRERRTASGWTHHFLLMDENDEPIGMSKRYSSEAAMEDGIALVKLNAPDASYEDLT